MWRGVPQWGTLDYHKQTLRNVAEASKRTHKLCAVMVDTLGREILVQRPSTLGPDGWPVHEENVTVKAGGEVRCRPYQVGRTHVHRHRSDTIGAVRCRLRSQPDPALNREHRPALPASG